MMCCCSSDSLGRRLSFRASSSFRFRIISRFRCTSSSVRMTVGQEGGCQEGWAPRETSLQGLKAKDGRSSQGGRVLPAMGASEPTIWMENWVSY